MCPHTPPADEELARTTAEMLSQQASMIATLSKELAASYEKELAFFDTLESRDRHERELEEKHLKKIWWLESERRQLLERVERLEAQHEAFRASRVGKLQQTWWRVRKGVRSWR